MGKSLTEQLNLLAHPLLEQQKEQDRPIDIQRQKCTLTTRAVFNAPCKHSWYSDECTCSMLFLS